MLNEQLIDKRTVERNIKKGRVDSAEYGRVLSALPDVSGKLWRRDESREPVAVASAPAETARDSWSEENVPQPVPQPAPLG